MKDTVMGVRIRREHGRASDPSSQVIADGGRRDVVGEVVVEGDVEDGHREVCTNTYFVVVTDTWPCAEDPVIISGPSSHRHMHIQSTL